MIIGIDVDGVIQDLITPMLEKYNKKHGTTWKKENWNHWNGIPSVNKEEIFDYLRNYKIEKTLWIKDAIKSIKYLSKKGHHIIFVTSIIKENYIKRIKLLESQFNDIKYDIMFTNRKYLVNLDVFIDDKRSNCNIYQAKHPNSLVIMIDQPHNQGLVSDKVVRLKTWNEIVTYLKY